MNAFAALTKRNILTYLRDRSSVFFSLMAMFMILLLYMLFLQKSMVNSLLNSVPGASSADINNYVSGWIMSGILAVNCITVTLGVYGPYVEDRHNGKLDSLLTAPIDAFTLSVSEITAAILVSCMFSVLGIAVAEIYIVANGGALLSFSELLKALLYLFASVLSSASIFYIVTMFTKSNGAFAAISTIIGTLIGFVGGIYMPVGAMGSGIQNLMKCFPVLYSASLLRELFTKSSAEAVFEGMPEAAYDGYSKYMGTSLFFGDYEVPSAVKLLILLGSAVIFTSAMVLILAKRRSKMR